MGTARTGPGTGVDFGLRQNAAQFTLLVVINALVGGMVGQQQTVLPLLAERRVRAHRLHVHVHLRGRLRHHQGDRQLLRRHLVGPVRPQARAGRGMAVRHPGAADADLGPELGVGRGGQRAAGHQPGPDLVDHGDHEDRSRRPEAARPGHGAERGRRVRRGRRHLDGGRLPGSEVRPAAGAVPARPVLHRAGARSVRRWWSRRPAATRGSRPPATCHGPTAATTTCTASSATARSSPRPACASRPCPRRARRAWSTTSTSACRGDSSRCCSPAPGCRSARSACCSRSTPRCGASGSCSPARCRTGGAAST